MDIIDYILGVLADIWDYFIAVLQWIWNAFVYIANIIWDALLKVFGFAWDFLKRAAVIVRAIWDNFIKRIFGKVLAAISKAHAWLEAKLSPIIRFLQRVRALYDRWFRLYIRPLLNTIQRIRRVLAILRLLHIHFADKLDAQLAKIEGKISQAVLTIRGILNNVIDVVTILSDPLLIIRRPTLVYSIRRIGLSLVRVFTGLPPGFFFPSPKKGAKVGSGFLPPGFNFQDTTFNPPASNYLGNDGLPDGFSGFVAGVTPDDSSVDDLSELDYFDESLYAQPACNDTASCLADAMNTYTTRTLRG